MAVDKVKEGIIGGHIRAARISAGITQAEAARSLGVAWQQFAKYESGANRVSASALPCISQCLGVSIGFLVYGPDDRECFSPPEMKHKGALKLLRQWGLMSPSQQSALYKCARAMNEQRGQSLTKEK